MVLTQAELDADQPPNERSRQTQVCSSLGPASERGVWTRFKQLNCSHIIHIHTLTKTDIMAVT